ncbi:GNAT family protein [Nocardioides sp. W7]|uniref:GNAT family N-acetyltransferase n=1 Tax=Nocardioides sp. W7 TaxID=2931390 RepID=UPI001FD5B905|nr:GNAT family protein [Nocardioides sp. W7]
MSGVFDRVAWPVLTERLSLRPAVPSDSDEVWRIRYSPGVSDWLTYRVEDVEVWREKFNDPERLDRTLVLELAGDPGRVVGDLMLLMQSPWSQAEVRESARDTQAELGWVLDPAYAGRGLATEAVRSLLGICFDQLGLRRVVANCVAANTASWRLMERVGMRREAHHVRAELLRDGTWADGYGYAILAEEWESSG